MNRLLATTALALLLPIAGALAGSPLPSPMPADQKGVHPTFMLGIAVEFGDSSQTPDVGVTAKVISSNKPNQFVAGAGVSYFPLSGDPFGIDLSAGFNLHNVTIMGGYDLLRQKPQISAGYAPTDGGDYFCSLPGYTLSGSTCNPPAPSDRRLKRDIAYIGTLSDGIRVYSFRYVWSDTVYVGVMAQDLLEDPRYRHAVVTGGDGFYLVDYDQLQLTMVTFASFDAFGLDAMVLGSRRAKFMAEAA